MELGDQREAAPNLERRLSRSKRGSNGAEASILKQAGSFGAPQTLIPHPHFMRLQCATGA